MNENREQILHNTADHSMKWMEGSDFRARMDVPLLYIVAFGFPYKYIRHILQYLTVRFVASDVHPSIRLILIKKKRIILSASRIPCVFYRYHTTWPWFCSPIATARLLLMLQPQRLIIIISWSESWAHGNGMLIDIQVCSATTD